MSNSEDFIFISPIPFSIRPASEGGTKFETLSPEECVEFFWRLRRITINASLGVFARKADKYSVPYWNDWYDSNLDSQQFDCILNKSMKERALKNFPNICNLSDGFSTLTITGPFLNSDYSLGNSFIDKSYAYSYGFQFGVGCVEISSNYIPTSDIAGGDSLHTVKRFPFQIFDKTFYLNLNIPFSIRYPEVYGLDAFYSGNAEIYFEFM